MPAIGPEPDALNPPADWPACEVQLPWPEDEFFAASGPVASEWSERRRFRRYHLRARAMIRLRRALPNRPRTKECHVVLTRDVCREGLCLLHAEELFPKEQFDIVLPGGLARTIEVVRCRKLADRCYEVAAVFRASGDGQSAAVEDAPRDQP